MERHPGRELIILLGLVYLDVRPRTVAAAVQDEGVA